MISRSAKTATSMDTTPDRDISESQLERKWKAIQKSFQTFHDQLDDFPHSFHLQNQENLLNDKLKKLKGTLESALSVGYKTALETARAGNLLAYIFFRLGRTGEALEQTQMVLNLEDEHQNIVSFANKAVILWRLGHRNEAEEQVQKLKTMKEELSEFPYLVVKAKAELAFCYTRFDPSFYPLAQTLFEEVILRAREPDLWLWKFGLAFTQRRMLRPVIRNESKGRENFQSVLELFLEIAKSCQSKSLKAKVYAEIALLLFMPRSADLKEILQKQAGVSVEDACSSALELDDKDNSVLWKCGKMYRYLRKTELSRDLLKKAVSVRKTSKGYHQLGLTYKALAIGEKNKASEVLQSPNESATDGSIDRVSEVNFNQFKTQLSRSTSNESESYKDHTQSTQQLCGSTHDTELYEDNACASEDKKPLHPAKDSTYQTAEKATKEAFELWKIVKCPRDGRDGMTSFVKGDAYLDETIEYLSLAVEISEWENAPAIYELALIFRSMGEPEQAKYYLERSLLKEQCLGIALKIDVFEQLGLTLADMAQITSCKEDRKRLTENSQSMLLMAVKTASESYNRVPAEKHHVGEIWNSFPALLEAVDRKENSSVVKLREKAMLFRLIRNNRKSLAILQDIEKMDPQKGNDPEHLKLCIENYVEMQQFEEALVFVDLLQRISQHEKVMQLFEDKQFLSKIYLQAAKRSLLRGSPNYRSHFRAVFYDIDPHDNTYTSSEDTDAEEDRKATWDVHLLHEETKEDTDVASRLASILSDLCGLRVTRMDEDVMGGFHLEGTFDVMRKCKVVIVMAGDRKPSKELRYFISRAACRPTSVSLLMNGGCVPRLMKLHRFLALPSELLHLTSPLDGEKLAEQQVAAICRIFGLLVNIDVDQLCGPYDDLQAN